MRPSNSYRYCLRYGHAYLMRRLVFCLLVALTVPYSVKATTYTVDDTGDASDDNAGNDVCHTTGNVCTLRAAIQEANSHSGTDIINFGISGSANITVNEAGCTLDDGTCGTALPSITETVTIDGTTQSGASCGDLWGGTEPTWPVHISTAHSENALSVGAANVVIKGLWITGVRHVGGGSEKSAISTSSDSTTVQCNRLDGFEVNVNIRSGGTNALIGGPSAGDGNVIVDSTDEGVLTQGAANTTIEGNFVGVLGDGQTPSATFTYGAITTRSSSTIIRHNLISGNSGCDTITGNCGNDGIVTEMNQDDSSIPSSVLIVGNRIGLALDGTPLGNGTAGIKLKDGDTIAIGGSGAGRNVISANQSFGVDIAPLNSTGGTNVTLTNNYIGVTTGGTENIGYCNFDPQVHGTYTDGGSNVIATNCALAGHCCQYDDGTPIGHAGSTCVDDTALYGAFGGNLNAVGGCAGFNTLVGGGMTITASESSLCQPTPGSTDSVCQAPAAGPTDTPTSLPTETPTITPTPSITPTPVDTNTPTPTPTGPRQGALLSCPCDS